MCVKPIHLAAYLLDPKTQGVELTENEEVDATEFIFDMAQNLNIDVMPNLANYKAKEGLWARRFIWSSIDTISPVVWWKGVCGSKNLSKIAIRILKDLLVVKAIYTVEKGIA
ncbi:hypothetical protein O0L34_g19379 [Tuta absoluta]|nr:hypothetical protein O0L34_g19379 [Tuta absoluta]